MNVRKESSVKLDVFGTLVNEPRFVLACSVASHHEESKVKMLLIKPIGARIMLSNVYNLLWYMWYHSY